MLPVGKGKGGHDSSGLNREIRKKAMCFLVAVISSCQAWKTRDLNFFSFLRNSTWITNPKCQDLASEKETRSFLEQRLAAVGPLVAKFGLGSMQPSGWTWTSHNILSIFVCRAFAKPTVRWKLWLLIAQLHFWQVSQFRHGAWLSSGDILHYQFGKAPELDT